MKNSITTTFFVILISFTLGACSPSVEGTYGGDYGTIVLKDGKLIQSVMGMETSFYYDLEDNKINVAVSEHATMTFTIDDAGNIVGPGNAIYKKQPE